MADARGAGDGVSSPPTSPSDQHLVTEHGDTISDDTLAAPDLSPATRRLMRLAATSHVRPLVRPCHLVIGPGVNTVSVSELTSEQRRALVSVEDEVGPTIERDFIKIEAEEHDIADHFSHNNNNNDGDDDNVAACRPGGSTGRAVWHQYYDDLLSQDDSPDYVPGQRSPSSSSSRCRRGRPPLSASRRGRRGAGRGTRRQLDAPATAVRQVAVRQTAGRIVLLDVADKGITVELNRRRLSVRRSCGVGNTTVELSEKELTFMQLVRLKEVIHRRLLTASTTDNVSMIQRLRAVRAQVIDWVENRLRAKSSASQNGGDSRQSGEGTRRRGRPCMPLSSPSPSASSLASTVAAIVDSDGDDGGNRVPDDNSTHGCNTQSITITTTNNAAVVEQTIDGSSSDGARRSHPTEKRVGDSTGNQRFKNGHHLGLLQAKLRDLISVENELRRSVEFFGDEVAADESRIARLRQQVDSLEKHEQRLNEHLSSNSHKLAYILLDKTRRKALAGNDPALVTCANLLSRLGHEKYALLLSCRLPLLTPRQLQDKCRGAEGGPWPDRKLLQAAHRTLKQRKIHATGATGANSASSDVSAARVRRAKPRHHEDVDVTAADVDVADVDVQECEMDVMQAAVDIAEDVVEGAEDNGDQITLPPGVLEQVMQGKGYLVDENGQRLEIRVLPDGNVVAGAHAIE